MAKKNNSQKWTIGIVIIAGIGLMYLFRNKLFPGLVKTSEPGNTPSGSVNVNSVLAQTSTQIPVSQTNTNTSTTPQTATEISTPTIITKEIVNYYYNQAVDNLTPYGKMFLG